MFGTRRPLFKITCMIHQYTVSSPVYMPYINKKEKEKKVQYKEESDQESLASFNFLDTFPSCQLMFLFLCGKLGQLNLPTIHKSSGPSFLPTTQTLTLYFACSLSE